MAVQNHLDLRQMDVCTAFLIPTLPKKEVIYMQPASGVYQYLRNNGVKIRPGQVLKLNKCIYGLRQASKYWNEELVKVLTANLNFKQVPEEPCLFVKQDKKSFTFILIWVDDLLMAGQTSTLNDVVDRLKDLLPMKDLGFPSEFTGVKIIKKEKGLLLSQSLFIEKALKTFNMTDCKGYDCPTVGHR